MKRLPAQIGLTYLSILAVVFYLDKKWTAVIGVAFLLTAILFLAIRKYRKKVYLTVMAFTAVFACVVNLSYTCFVYNKTVEKYNDTTATVTAVLREEPYDNFGNYIYKFKCKSVNGEKASFNFTTTHRDLLNIDVGDKVQAQVELHKSSSKNKIANGYYITADFGYDYPQLEVTTPAIKGPYYYAVKFRQLIREFLKNNLSADAYTLCSALFLGDKYIIPQQVKTDFIHAGVSHIIVVSGMHFSIIFGVFLILANKFYRYRVYILLSAGCLALVYMALTGFTPSVCRSGVMTLFCVTGLLIAREPYSPISLSVAGVIITLFKGPYIAGDVGLILSFATTFSIIMLAPILCEYFFKRIKIPKIKIKSSNTFLIKSVRIANKMPTMLISMLCVNISAYIVALPLSIVFFHSAPTLSIISGFVLYFPIEALMFLTLIMCLTAFLPFVTAIFAVLINFISEVTLSIVGWFADIPFSYVDITYKFVCLWILCYIVLLALVFLYRTSYQLSLFTILVTILFLTGYVTATVFSSGVSNLYVYDVNDGIAVVYSSKEISAVLNIECSNYDVNYTVDEIKYTVPNLQFAAGVNNSTDSGNSLKSLSEKFAIDTVLLYDTKRTVKLSDSVQTVIEMEDSQTVEFSDGSKAEYILADEKCVVYFTYSSNTLLILPQAFDVENLSEKYREADTIILSDYPKNSDLLSCNTLIVNAHGSAGRNLIKLTHSIANRVLMTCDGDIKLVTEV